MKMSDENVIFKLILLIECSYKKKSRKSMFLQRSRNLVRQFRWYTWSK